MNLLRRSVFAVVLTASIALAQSGAAQLADVKKAEEAWVSAVTKSDSTAAGSLLSEDLVYTHSTGTIDTKSQYLEKMKAGTQKYTSLEYSDQKVRTFGNTAVVNGTIRMQGSTNGVPFDNTVLVTHVWVKQGGDWKLVSHQTTRKAA